ncbi:MAG: DUF4399 domain-containing protein [Nitrospinales bacterium]
MALFIKEPQTGATVKSPVKVCMEVLGVELEPATNGVNPGKGHHHIIIDMPLPSIVEPREGDLMPKITSDDNHIHLSDGAPCGVIRLDPGPHIIRGLFSKGNHIPFNPILADTIIITVVE